MRQVINLCIFMAFLISIGLYIYDIYFPRSIWITQVCILIFNNIQSNKYIVGAGILFYLFVLWSLLFGSAYVAASYQAANFLCPISMLMPNKLIGIIEIVLLILLLYRSITSLFRISTISK